MSNLQATSSWRGAIILAALCLWGITLHVAAQSEGPKERTTQEIVPKTASAQHKVAFQRSPDYACTQCHKDEKNKFLGLHNDVINKKTGRDFTCIDCHASISPSHRDGANDVLKFNRAQSAKGTDVKAAKLDVIALQNESCESCHDGAKLRAATWTHDVHARNLTCASCHAVHPVKDPMKKISRKATIETCVQCHFDQRKAREEEK